MTIKAALKRLLSFFGFGLDQYRTGSSTNLDKLETAMAVRLKLVQFKVYNRKKYRERIFNFNYTGRSLIKRRFARANYSKYIAIYASYLKVIIAIIGPSLDMDQPDDADLLYGWEAHTKRNNIHRKIRHVIIGNL